MVMVMMMMMVLMVVVMMVVVMMMMVVVVVMVRGCGRAGVAERRKRKARGECDRPDCQHLRISSRRGLTDLALGGSSPFAPAGPKLLRRQFGGGIRSVTR